MIRAVLAGETDWCGWRAAARRLCAAGIAPGEIAWEIEGGQPDLLGGGPSHLRASDRRLRVPRRFVECAERVVCHRDPERFARLYRVLFRLQEDPRLMANAADIDIAWLLRRDKAVRRDEHKMHAFVRFRKIGEVEGRERFAAWFEPEHRIVELAAPFFVRRFPNMDWAILTPDRTALWQDGELAFGAGARRGDAPSADAVEDDWRTYFAAVFNPARLKVKAMTAEMPRKYWANLPEAVLIPSMIARAGQRTETMQERGSTERSMTARRLEARRSSRVFGRD